MGGFEDMKTNWQNQATAPGPFAEDLVRELRGYSRRRIRKLVAGTVLALLLLSFTMLLVVGWSTLATVGGLLVVAGVAVGLAAKWRAHLTIARLEFTAPPADFARAAAEKLRRQERLRPVQYCALLVGPLAGMNVVMAAFLPGQWQANVIGSLLVIVGVGVGLQARKKSFRREVLPLLERLESFADEARD